MSTPDFSAEMQLFAALAAMSEANLALRSGAWSAPAIRRAARCLELLADNPDLAPALRAQCDVLGSHWESLLLSFPGTRQPRPDRSAAIVPLRPRRE